MAELPSVSRLKDGRLFFMDKGRWLVSNNGSWVEPVGIKLGAVTESKPLTDDEIRALASAGKLPQ
jgi:hypothetical protein